MAPREARPLKQFLTAREAAALLGVSRASLYSYVSRGRIRVQPDARHRRRSRYLASDVEQLRDHKEARLHPDIAARKTLDLGLPILESSLTLIDRGRVFYRGRDVTRLATRKRFEDVVRLLWNAGSREWPQPSTSVVCRDALARVRSLPPVQRMQAVLPFAAAADPIAFDTSADHLMASGASILHLLAAAATACAPRRPAPLAETLASGWRVHDERHRRLIDMALILCADHELNVSAFAARVVASALSTPYDVVAAGLGALRGPRHGGHTSRVEGLFDEAGSPSRLRAAVASRLDRGESIPGFGHRLYPRGDPRARILFSTVQRTWPRSEAAAYVAAVRRVGRTLVGEHPTIDMGLVILRRALGLPRDSALVLFALGRTAGWLAHAMEQYASDQLIRPRASYVGAQPR